MILMVAIGAGVFVGFNAEWYSLQKDTSAFLEQTNYADYRVYANGGNAGFSAGFSESDRDAILGIEGVDAAARVLAVNVNIKDEKDMLSLFVSESDTVSSAYVTSGAEYDAANDGFWLSDKYARANGLSLGDTLTLVYLNQEISGEVVGLVKSAEYMVCVSDENQLMPDYSSFGFVYASPKMVFEAVGQEIYPQINIRSSLSKSEIESKIADALGKTVLILSKEEHTAYAAAQSEIEEGQTMGSVLPVLFLLIGILTMITTMHRITANEKTQIGTLKALGFKDGKILRHYSAYGLFIGLLGAVLGVGLGLGIAAFIVNPTMMQGTYFDMPCWDLYIPWFCWLVLAATVAFLTLISFLSVKNMLKGTAADALRPYTPKKMKAMAVEKTRVWNKLSFSAKWNLRDVFRHKSRSLMTLIGIVGCMMLLVGGLGMSDTMNEYLDVIDTKLYNYQTRVNLAEAADNDGVLTFASVFDGDLLASSQVSYGGDPVTLDIYDVTHGKMRFIDQDNKNVTIGDDGVYLCMRLADGVKIGDTVTLSAYGSDLTYEVRVAGVIRSVVSENITMTCEYAATVGIDYTFTAVFTDASQTEIQQYIADNGVGFVSGMQSKQAIMDSYDGFMEIMDTMVLVLIVAAVILGVVVLYNLGIMSYVERYRELATLKVVGFKDRRIGGILISQNIWLTVVGVLIGLPAGVGVLQLLIMTLAGEYELKLALGALTYTVSILLTFGVSLLVSLFVSRKNKKIDMVEALKGAE